MKFNMKFSSQQIIIVIVAFLVGIGATLLFTGDKSESTTTENKITEENVTETDETDETAKLDEITPADTTKPATTATTKTTTAATTTKPPTEFVTGKCSTGLSGKKDDKLNAIVLYWSPCASDDFQFYKLVKSTKNPNLSYPADNVVFSSTNKNAANFIDKTVAQRTTYYYRMCVIQRLGQVNCSNVATVSF